MKKQLLTLWLFLTLAFGLILSAGADLAHAAISNPVIGKLGTDVGGEASSGSTFLNYFITIWQAIIFVGGLAVLVYFLWGSIQWIVAGGDSSKISAARDKMTQAIIGMIILVGSFVIIEWVSSVFFGGEYNLLNPDTEFLNNTSGSSGGGTRSGSGLTPDQAKIKAANAAEEAIKAAERDAIFSP